MFSVEPNRVVPSFNKEHEVSKKSNAGKTQTWVIGGLRFKKVELKSEPLAGAVLQSAFNNFAKFKEKYLC